MFTVNGTGYKASDERGMVFTDVDLEASGSF
jgi:hypothetical protein